VTALLQRGARMLLPQLPLAAAVAAMLWLVAGGRIPGGAMLLAGLAAIAGGLVVLATPLAVRAAGHPRVEARSLPSYRSGRRGPAVFWVRLGGGVLVLLLTAAAWSGQAEAVGGAVVVVVLAAAVVLVVEALALRSRATDRARVRGALERLGPRLVVYTGRRNGGAYQLQMWLPVLDRLGLPYLVVVRHAAAVPVVARLTAAPVVCCPAADDLDCVVVESLRAACYVNMVSENTNFVLYRSMTHIYLGHGDSDKELSTHPAHAMFDKIFVAGPAAVERYARSGVLIPAEKLVVVGRPQLAGVQRALQPIGRTASPRVLVAPTWRGYNTKTSLSSLPATAALVRRLLDRGAEVIFRPHPFSWLAAGERAAVEEADRILAADRAGTGRAHVLAAEQRSWDVSRVFNHCDALITDVGSLLVDFFATGKPYAVVLPETVDEASAREQFPTLAAAYLLPITKLRQQSSPTVADALNQLLGPDPLSDSRAETARHYLGDNPGTDLPFLAAVRAIVNDKSPAGR
jgi:hypothetical protein